MIFFTWPLKDLPSRDSNLLSQTPVSFVAVERPTVSRNFYSLIIDYTAKSLEI